MYITLYFYFSIFIALLFTPTPTYTMMTAKVVYAVAIVL